MTHSKGGSAPAVIDFKSIDKKRLTSPTRLGASTGSAGNRGDLIIYPSAARTATPAAVDLVNTRYGNYRGVKVVIDVTAGATLSLTVTIKGKDPLSGKYFTILASAALTGVGTTVLTVYPGMVASANAVASDVLPDTWQVTVTHGNANPATYTVAALMLP